MKSVYLCCFHIRRTDHASNRQWMRFRDICGQYTSATVVLQLLLVFEFTEHFCLVFYVRLSSAVAAEGSHEIAAGHHQRDARTEPETGAEIVARRPRRKIRLHHSEVSNEVRKICFCTVSCASIFHVVCCHSFSPFNFDAHHVCVIHRCNSMFRKRLFLCKTGLVASADVLQWSSFTCTLYVT